MGSQSLPLLYAFPLFLILLVLFTPSAAASPSQLYGWVREFDSPSPATRCTAFRMQRTFYAADLHPTVRVHVGSATNILDATLAFHPPGDAGLADPNSPVSDIRRHIAWYIDERISSSHTATLQHNQHNLYDQRMELRAKGEWCEFHVRQLSDVSMQVGKVLPSLSAVHAAYAKSTGGNTGNRAALLFLDRASVLWETYTGYELDDVSLTLLRDTPAHPVVPPFWTQFNILQLQCDPVATELGYRDPAVTNSVRTRIYPTCIVPDVQVGSTTYRIVLDLDQATSYLPTGLYEGGFRDATWDTDLHYQFRYNHTATMVHPDLYAYDINTETHDIVLGANALRYYDQVYYDHKAFTYTLRSDQGESPRVHVASHRAGAVRTVSYVLALLNGLFFLYIRTAPAGNFGMAYDNATGEAWTSNVVRMSRRAILVEFAGIVLAILSVGIAAPVLPYGTELAFGVLATTIGIQVFAYIVYIARSWNLVAGLYRHIKAMLRDAMRESEPTTSATTSTPTTPASKPNPLPNVTTRAARAQQKQKEAQEAVTSIFMTPVTVSGAVVTEAFLPGHVRTGTQHRKGSAAVPRFTFTEAHRWIGRRTAFANAVGFAGIISLLPGADLTLVRLAMIVALFMAVSQYSYYAVAMGFHGLMSAHLIPNETSRRFHVLYIVFQFLAGVPLAIFLAQSVGMWFFDAPNSNYADGSVRVLASLAALAWVGAGIYTFLAEIYDAAHSRVSSSRPLYSAEAVAALEKKLDKEKDE